MLITSQRRKQRGQTIALVAVSLVAILAMAVLAIDVVTLYVAREDAQRAADAAALAGAKALVDSGLTSESCTSGTFSITSGNAQTAATQQATAVAQQNLIAGQPAQLAAAPVYANVTCPSINPQITVQIQSTNVPTFFARIWSRGAVAVSATATAEGYNPSHASSVAGGAARFAPRCPKPMMFPNCDPVAGHTGGASTVCSGYKTFVDPTSGAISNPGLAPTGTVGEVIHFSSGCDPATPGSCTPLAPTPSSPPPQLQYYPIQLASGTHTCQSCGSSLSGFSQDVGCCNSTPLQCGATVSIDSSVFPDGNGNAGQVGGQCMVHEPSPASYISDCQPGGSGNNQQDCIDSLTSLPSNQLPFRMFAGTKNPAIPSGIAAGDQITTSDSLATFPIYDNGVAAPPSGSLPIVGFLQIFINDVDDNGNFTGTIVNVAGCDTSLTGTPLQGAGNMLPVRLIHQ